MIHPLYLWVITQLPLPNSSGSTKAAARGRMVVGPWPNDPVARPAVSGHSGSRISASVGRLMGRKWRRGRRLSRRWTGGRAGGGEGSAHGGDRWGRVAAMGARFP
jgi:hypothetical protein